ncbi:MAG: ankyrin repeat domain-containing protein [Pirellulaceae bacterium]|nr:ankyrin repeat domain-containing protein [Pirellulaceae bacterium]
MRINGSLSWRVGEFLLAFASCFAFELCHGADPKIVPVKVVDIDISKQIDPEPQGGGTLLPLRKLNYEHMRSMIRDGYGVTLLADGADPNAVSADGEPILFYVLWYGKNDILEAFLKAGADPNRKARDGSNPLHSAIWRKNVAAVKLLLQYGADPNAVSSGQTAIEYARAHQVELVGSEANNLPKLKPSRFQPPKFLRHPDKVFGSAKFRPAIGGEAVIYSNDSRQVISGGNDGAIRFFDASSGEIQNVSVGTCEIDSRVVR